MSPMRFNVGIIGYGLSAKIFHIPFIQAVPEFKLQAIVQRSPKPGDDASKDHPDVQIHRSVEELLKDNQINVVIVTTAPDSHLALAKAALLTGKHVVVEKPFTTTSSEADELVAVAKQHDLLLTVYQNRRWDSDYLTLSKCIGNGSLGRVVEFETHFDRHRPEVPSADSWKYKVLPGGGVVYDLGTHLMDQVVHLFGIPERITGFVGSQRLNGPPGYEDSCTILMHYRDGLLATVKAGVVSPETEQLRYWVRGEKGSFKKFHLDCQEDQLKAGMRPGDDGYGLEPRERYGVLSLAEHNNVRSEVIPTVEPPTYTEFYRKLARALAGDESQIPVDPAVAASVIRLVELARESSSQRKTLDV